MRLDIRQWPGMRSEYSLFAPTEDVTWTGPHQVGIAFSGHDDLHNYTSWRDSLDPALTDLLRRVWAGRKMMP